MLPGGLLRRLADQFVGLVPRVELGLDLIQMGFQVSSFLFRDRHVCATRRIRSAPTPAWFWPVWGKRQRLLRIIQVLFGLFPGLSFIGSQVDSSCIA